MHLAKCKIENEAVTYIAVLKVHYATFAFEENGGFSKLHFLSDLKCDMAM